MSLVQKLMGRRQFLIATGLASTCALTCDKLAKFQMRSAMAAEQTQTAAIKAAGNRCPNLLSPLRIRNRVLKNRIMHTVSPTYFMQGPENFPTEMFRNHYSNMAKNAAIVTMSSLYSMSKSTSTGTTYDKSNDNAFNHYCDHAWDDIPMVENYVNQMMEDIHCEGALILGSGGGGGGMPGGGQGGPGGGGGGTQQGQAGTTSGQGDMSGGTQQGQVGTTSGQGGMSGGMQQGQGGQGGAGGGQGGMRGMFSRSDDDILADAKKAEERGYDVYQINSASKELANKIKAATNLILMGSIRGSEGGGMPGGMMGGGGMPGGGQGGQSGGQGGMTSMQQGQGGMPGSQQGQGGQGQSSGMQGGGMMSMGGGQKTSTYNDSNQPTAKELEEGVEQARKLEGIADLVWIRIDEHPNAWNQDKGSPKSLAYAEAIKKAGIKIITCPSAGFHDPVENDKFIADGKTDMVGMTTPFFADPELVRKLKEGRSDDVIPCLACQNCHGISMTKQPWYSTCTVNPKWGLPPYKLSSITKPAISKKVAVIGGGPAGMKAALVAAERGHKVTLFEKDAALGGLLKISDNSKCRWNYKDLKEYFIHQVKKAGVDVQLNITATPEMIKSKGFDTVLVATGADVVTTKMKTDGSKVFNILDSYYKKNELGKNVVVLGAGKFGVEAAASMLKDGHKVTLVTNSKELVSYEDTGPHNMRNQEDIYNSHPNFTAITEATVKDISGGKVTYTDSTGKEKSVQADSIVVWSGLKPRMDEAEKFIGSADDVLFLGDCTGKGGTVLKTLRSAFFIASQV